MVFSVSMRGIFFSDILILIGSCRILGNHKHFMKEKKKLNLLFSGWILGWEPYFPEKL